MVAVGGCSGLRCVRSGGEAEAGEGVWKVEVSEVKNTSSAKIVLDSVGPNGARLTTFELRYPRFVHAELMTHRMFSRNSASSRAIPTETILKQIEDDPAMPVWWGKNQSGMQAREELAGDDKEDAERVWTTGRDAAVGYARALNRIGLHKQIANRVVEPWMYITVLVTSTEFGNMRALRVHPDAQPEFQDVARKAFELFDRSVPQEIAAGTFHLPLVTGVDLPVLSAEKYTISEICKISIGRCARVSYLTHEGTRDPGKDIELCDRLQASGHMSPFEHVAMAMTRTQWTAVANAMAVEWVERRVPIGNFWGWQQWRKTLTNEHDFSRVER